MTETQTKGREERILEIIETTRSKRPRFKDERITMAHGAGGKATQTLIEGLLAPAFASDALDQLADAGAVRIAATPPPRRLRESAGIDLALTTDTYVVKPLRFPGGSIGELAVNGTVNDLAAAGAEPLAISLALVLEEGLDADDPARRGRGDRRRPRARPGSRSSPATPRWSSAATPTGCT